MKIKKILSIVVILGILTTMLVGCGSKDTSADKGVKKIRVAVANDFNPYAYLDDKGEYIGYEIDVLKKVDELLPNYEFEYQTFSDQFVALTANKADLIAHQWESNPKRQETYLFGKQLVTTWAAHIIFKDGRTDIQTIGDLEGKTVETYQGSNDAYFLETYNKEHNNAITLTYSSGDTAVTLRFVDLAEENYKVTLGHSDKPVYNSNTYFIFRKDDKDETALADAVDGALKTLTDDGTLKSLSIQWLGDDFTKEVDIK